MKSGITAKSLVLFFLAVLVLYLGAFYGCEHVRRRKGPWQVQFVSDASGRPSIIVDQPALGVSSMEILFHGERVDRSNLSERVMFDRPLKAAVFGKVIYEDLTFLPGVVTFDLFGHEVELLPRVLIINKKEVPWKSDSKVELSAAEKPREPPRPPRRR